MSAPSLRARPFRSLLLLAFLGSGLAGCQPPPASPEQAAAATAPAAPPVSVAAAITRDIVESDEFPGRFAAVESVEIRARVSGYLQGIHFTPGTEVERGALLFTIDPRPFEASLAEAEAQRANTLADLELARTELARQNTMLADRATSQREFDAAKATVARLEALLRAHDAAIATARLDLGYTRITAPVAGRVGKEEVTIGNLVRGDAPDSPVLTTLVSVDPIYVTFEADERAWLRYIAAAGDTPLDVAVGLADEDGFPHAARLAFVDNRVDPGTGTLRLRAVIDNPARRFAPGLFARVRLAARSAARPAVLIADRAVGTDQSRRFVVVVDEQGMTSYRQVELGRLVDGLRVIERGLEAGETIVVNGLQRVRPGMPVTPEPVEMTSFAATPASSPDAG